MTRFCEHRPRSQHCFDRLRGDGTVMEHRCHTSWVMGTAVGHVIEGEGAVSGATRPGARRVVRHSRQRGSTEEPDPHVVESASVINRVNAVPFVGRDDERRGLATFAGNESASVLVVGEAGIGKSRLVAETIGGTGGSNSVDRLVLSGEVWAGGSVTLFLAWRQIVAAATSIIDPTGSDASRFAELAPLLPGCGATAGSPITETDRHLLALALADYLRQVVAAADRPVSVIIENIHDADLFSIELLERIAGQHLPLSLIATSRPFCDADPLLHEPLDSCFAGFSMVALAPLGRVAVGDLLRQQGVSDEYLADAMGRTRGVPVALRSWMREHADTNTARERAVVGAAPSTSWMPELEAAGVFVRNGSMWTVGIGEERGVVGHVKGMSALVALLEHGRGELPVLQIAALLEGAAPAHQVGRGESHHVLLDETALRQYRERVVGLEAEVDEAATFNDFERQAKAQAELDDLVTHIARSVGLGGRSRAATNSAERARVRVTKSIRTAIARVLDVAPHLGRHLDASISTGSYCSYDPVGPSNIAWTTA